MEEPDFLFNAEAFDGASASAAKEVEELLSDMDSGLFFNDAGSWASGMPHSASANTGAGGNPGPKAAAGASSNNSVAMMAEAAEQFTLGGLPEPPTGQKQQQPQQQQQQQPAPPAPSQAGIMAPPSSFAMAPASSEANKSRGGLSAGFAAPPLWKGSGGGTGASGGAEDGGGAGPGAGAGSTAMEQGGLRSRSESFNALMDETGSILSSDSSIWGLDTDAGSNVIPPQYQMFTGLGGGAGAGAGGPAASFIMPSSPVGVSAASRLSSVSSVGGGGGGALRRRALGAKGLGGVEAQLLRGGETSLGPVKRKQDRNAREQKRSLKISQQIGHLKDVLEEDGKKVKNSKMAILVSVQEYIRELESQISVLQLSRNSALGQQPQQPHQAQQPQQQAGGPGKGEGGGSVGGGSVGGSGGDGVAALMLPPPALTVTSKKSAAMSASGEEAMTAAGVEGASGVDYQSLFHQVSTPLAVAGVDGRFVDANARFQMATGYSKEELGKLTLFNLVCPEDLQETFGTVARMLNEPGAGESRFTRRALPKQRGVGLGSGERQRSQPLFVTISLVRQNGVPQFFQCSMH